MPERKSNKRSGIDQSTLKASKKRRTERSLHLQPEEAQIFRGFVFFYVPNNDIATARKRRIQKAQEYGVRWAREWSDEVTHVIADAHLTLSDVEKAVRPKDIKSDVIIVNEKYPPECVNFKALLPPDRTRFQLATGDSEVRADDKQGQEGHTQAASPEKTLAGKLSPIDSSHSKRKPPHTASEANCVADDTVGQVRSGDLQDRVKASEDDALDKLVSEVRETADLPLDSDDESFELDLRRQGFASERFQATREPSKQSTTLVSKVLYSQGRFSCMHKNEGTSIKSNPNHQTIEKLEKMARYYDRTGDHWRTIAYRKGIAALKKQSDHIKTREQALGIPGVGDRLAGKVEEIAFTNRLKRLDNTALDPTDQLLQLFMGIYQVGLPTASRWIAQGHKSLQDLRLRADLTSNQKLGIDHYDDFLARIPRDEVAAHAEIVRKACAEADAAVQLIIGGSYRRGGADCGDIDLIVTKVDATVANIRTVLTSTVIPELFDKGFLKAGLAIPSSSSSSSSSSPSSRSKDEGSKWHGACALPDAKVWRRIDLLFVPGDELGAAMIYFTGNDIFNRSMRLLARKKDMRLNQHGLYADVMRGDKSTYMTRGRLLESRSEERIFEILGVPWRPPEHRVC